MDTSATWASAYLDTYYVVFNDLYPGKGDLGSLAVETRLKLGTYSTLLQRNLGGLGTRPGCTTFVVGAA